MMSSADPEQRPVLIAYDGSSQAKGAIIEAGRVLGAGRPRSSSSCVSRSTTSTSQAWAEGPRSIPRPYRRCRSRRRTRRPPGPRRARASPATPASSPSLGSGPTRGPWQEIVAVADELDADVIAIGSRGRTGISKVLLGSVAAAVAQHSGRSVLIVRAEATGRPDES